MTPLVCFEIHLIGVVIAWALFYAHARHQRDREESVWGQYVFGRNIVLDSLLLALFWPFWLGLYLMVLLSGVDV